MKISISVPKPCHENWNAMTERTDPGTGIGGRHCDRCEHTVIDLTRVSDAQLIDLFRKDAMPKCARFSQGQLDRVIALEERTPRLIPAAAVGAALALASPDAHAQSCLPTVGKMMISVPVPPMEPKAATVAPLDSAVRITERIRMGQPVMPLATNTERTITGDTIAVVVEPVPKGEMDIRPLRETGAYYVDGVKVHAGAGQALPISALEAIEPITGGIPEEYLQPPHGPFYFSEGPAQQQTTIIGRVLDEHGEPLPYVHIALGETSLGCFSAINGRFEMEIPDSLSHAGLPLMLHCIGYASVEVPLGKGGSTAIAPHAPIYVEDKQALTGRVLFNGKPIMGCTVEVVGTDKRLTVDKSGFFGFDLIGDSSEWTLRAGAPDGHVGTTVVPASALPCCVSIVLEVGDGSAAVKATPIDLGDLRMKETEMMILGEWVGEYPPSPTILSRIAPPFRWIGRQVSRPFR